mmetsp:Transcript_60874/g.120569  ORF Transcript_60874/g.120569 Transcript_60874/m.120569 type:complete len:200 (-) Transcript_60874:222-821(-)
MTARSGRCVISLRAFSKATRNSLRSTHNSKALASTSAGRACIAKKTRVALATARVSASCCTREVASLVARSEKLTSFATTGSVELAPPALAPQFAIVSASRLKAPMSSESDAKERLEALCTLPISSCSLAWRLASSTETCATSTCRRVMRALPGARNNASFGNASRPKPPTGDGVWSASPHPEGFELFPKLMTLPSRTV